MPSCFICSRTRNAESKKGDISFHRISKKDGIREQWLEFFKECGKDISTIKLTSAICSEHFKPEDFMKYLRNKTLHENAVPSIVVNRLKYAKKTVPEVLTQLTNHGNNGVPGVSPLPDEPELELVYSEPSTSNETYTVNKPKSDSIKLVVDSILSPKDEDTPRKKLLRQSVAMLSKENKNQSNKIKILSQKVRRQKQRIVSLRGVIKVLKNKSLISEEQAMLLDSNFGKQRDLINNFCKKNAGRKVAIKYSLELRKFAVTLNFYSPKAYQFIRREFNSALPCPRTLRCSTAFSIHLGLYIEKFSRKTWTNLWIHKIFTVISIVALKLRCNINLFAGCSTAFSIHLGLYIEKFSRKTWTNLWIHKISTVIPIVALKL